MTLRLKGKAAIVTGAGAAGEGIGNGRAISLLFAREGARVLAVDRDVTSVRRTQEMIKAEGGVCEVSNADVSSGHEVAAMVRTANDLFGRIDAIVNNVGVAALGGPVELAEEEWDRVFDVNVKSMYLTCKHILPIMVEQGGGAIVNISSVASIRWGTPPLLAYSASKAAVNGLTQNVAMQYAGSGVRSNAILPGLINTPMIREPLARQGVDVDRHVIERGRVSPTGAMGTGWDVAAAAAFLASDEAAYINGVLLPVDGGLSLQVHVAPQPAR